MLSYRRIREQGPKNYAYGIVDPVIGSREMVCKIRGITLNYSASQTVNFDDIKAPVLRRDDTETVTVYTQHKVKRKNADVKFNRVMEPEVMIYRSHY